MELRQLTTFRTVAQTLSFSKTATILDYAQSTVSAQIQALESELQVSLFDRLGKQVVLTDAGRRLLGYAEQMVTLAGEAKTAVSTTDIPTGLLTISAPETLCVYRLPDVLRAFRSQYPQVQLTFCPSPYRELENALRNGEMDVAFVLDTPLHTKHLETQTLLTEPLKFVAHPEHHLVGEITITLPTLANELLLLTEADCTYRRHFERRLTTNGIKLTPPVEFHSVEAIKQCVMAGVGMTFLPEIAVHKELATGDLIEIPFAGEPFQIFTQIAWHKDKWLSPTVSAFIEVAQDCLSENHV